MRKIKNISAILMACSMAFSLCACSGSDDKKNSDVKESVTSAQTESTTNEEVSPEETDANEATTEEASVANNENDFSYADMSDIAFSFLSGAGGWSTDLTINADGSFSGTYHDSDFDVAEDGTSRGLMYLCVFEGQFGELEKVDDLTYKTTITSLTYANKVGEEEIIDDVRYVYSEAYGLDDHKDIYFYLKGSKIDDLPEDFVNWIRFNIYDYDTEEYATELPFIGMYNENAGEGFSSYKFSDNYAQRINNLKDASDSMKKEMQETEMTQTEMNKKSEEIAKMWDELLNEMWGTLKNTLPEDEMEQLTIEEREWIASKEDELEKISKEYEGGSILPMTYNLKLAELTEARVYELLEYFK